MKPVAFSLTVKDVYAFAVEILFFHPSDDPEGLLPQVLATFAAAISPLALSPYRGALPGIYSTHISR
jgi:hypothetical protein